MSAWLIVAGLLGGLGCWLCVRELIPCGPSLRAAIARLDCTDRGDEDRPARARLGHWVSAAAPWVPVPVKDLRLLGQDPADWLARKIGFGIAGLALVPLVSGLLALTGRSMPWTVPAAGSLALGTLLFLVPDLLSRGRAARCRADLRHALTSYLDLVVLERGAGAAPTEALEAAAEVGRGWAFELIGAALSQARRASRPPWDGLAGLAAEVGIPELADLAQIARLAGQEGARILETLSARAESMRGEALASTKAQAGARSTTMVLPIALLAGGFLVLLIFPDFYRLFG